MGNQFKKPFSNPEEQRPQAPLPAAIPEQATLMQPVVPLPPSPGIPSQVYDQGQFVPRPGGQLFHGAGQFGETAGKPAGQVGNLPFGGPQGAMPPINPPLGGPQGAIPSMKQPFGDRQDNMSTRQPFGGPLGGMPVNSLFGGMQGPPGAPLRGSGPAFGNQGMIGTGGIVTPNPAWNTQRPSTSEFNAKPASVRERERNQGKGRKEKRRVPIWARIVIGILLFFIVLGTGGFVYYQTTYAPVLNSVTGKQFTRLPGDGDPNQGKTGSILNWGRINILLLGSDTDEKANWSGNLFLAQTVIVVSLDTSTHDVDMLSIPRDYYIRIPGYGLDKLDTAFAHGGSINNNMSGVGVVSATLYQDFGIKINYYAWVGLQGFIKVIDTVHGVDVNVMHPVVDDTYPDDVGTKSTAQSNYKRVYIPDGPQHLDGPTALEYVRSRHSTNDFDRSARQQQVLGALKLKLSNPGIVGDLPQIAKDLQGWVATSLSPSQVLDLGNFARGIQTDKIKHLTLGGSLYSTSGTIKLSSGTEDVVYPRCDTVPQAIDTFLHITTAVCNTTLGPDQQSSLLASSPSSGVSAGVSTNTFSQTSVSMLADDNFTLGQSMPAFSDLFGLRGLLDLMSMVVLNSPQV